MGEGMYCLVGDSGILGHAIEGESLHRSANHLRKFVSWVHVHKYITTHVYCQASLPAFRRRFARRVHLLHDSPRGDLLGLLSVGADLGQPDRDPLVLQPLRFAASLKALKSVHLEHLGSSAPRNHLESLNFLPGAQDAQVPCPWGSPLRVERLALEVSTTTGQAQPADRRLRQHLGGLYAG